MKISKKLIAHLNDVLAHVELRMEIIKNELLAVKAQYGDDRRTDIVYASEEFNPEDFYADEEMVITISHMGYIKRTPLSEYKVQNRGGVGSKGSATRDEDFLGTYDYGHHAQYHAFLYRKGKMFLAESIRNTRRYETIQRTGNPESIEYRTGR